MKRNGAFVNPLNQKFPRSEPVPSTLLARFREAITPVAASLDTPSLATVTGPVH
jgi:hypothetical protein